MSQIPRLPDPSNLQATIQPIDTYFRPTEQQVAGAPVGPNPARQIAQALGQFNSATQQFYFEPAHQQMIQQQQADAQLYHQRLENFQAFSEAVGRGEIHQGDNPWLQAFTKEMYAKDAANELSVRTAELSDRQDILSGEYGETGDATASFNLAFEEAKQQVLEQQGGSDPYLSQVFNQLSEPVRARSANQFAQGLRRHNIQDAFNSLRDNLSSQLETLIPVLGPGDELSTSAISIHAEEITGALRNLKVSNLLPVDTANGMVADLFIARAREIGQDNPEAGRAILDVLGQVETSSGSLLSARPEVRNQISSLENSLDIRSRRLDDEEEKERSEARREAARSLTRDYQALRREDLAPEDFQEQLEGLILAAEAGGVSDPRGLVFGLLRSEEALREQLNPSTSDTATDPLVNDLVIRLWKNEADEEDVLNFLAESGGDITPGDRSLLLSLAEDKDPTVNLPGDVREYRDLAETRLLQEIQDSYTEMNFLTQREELTTEGVEVITRTRAMIGASLREYVNSPDYAAATPTQRREQVDKIIEGVVTETKEKNGITATPKSSSLPPVPVRTQAVVTRFAESGNSVAQASLKRQELEQQITEAANPALEGRLKKKLETAKREERSQYNALQSRLSSILSGPDFRFGTQKVDRGFAANLFHSDTEHIQPFNSDRLRQDLEYLSTSVSWGPLAARGFYERFRARDSEFFSVSKNINPYKVLMFNSIEDYNRQYAEYQEVQKDPSILEKSVSAGGGVAIPHPANNNIFLMFEKDFEWDLTEGSQRERQLSQAVARMLTEGSITNEVTNAD